MSRAPRFLRRWATDVGAFCRKNAARVERLAVPSERLEPGRLRVAITIAAPSRKIASRWGDSHFAHGFARGLERLGHVVDIQTFDRRDSSSARACDVRCVVRGLQPVRRSSDQTHVLWIISHPDDIDVSECDDADLVLVASQRFAEHLRTRTRTPVEVMLQATDPDRFRPTAVDPRHAHDIAVVAKSRDVYRGAVRDAIAAGLKPAIYGSGWEQFVDPQLIAATYVPNEELAVVYSSIGVLLNDHWDDMRRHGFVSNRIFDALACGTPVISDSLPEISTLFGDAVLMYEGSELRERVESVLRDRVAARARTETGRSRVLEHHTFEHRARALGELLRRHGIDPNPG